MSTKYVTRSFLECYLDELLQIKQFNDYCPNGLQVEGRDRIHRLVTGVSANQALIKEAIHQKADAILVHHGYFWKNEASPVTHIKKQRLALLLSHDMNLFTYHLPLDAHMRLGNNIELGRMLGIEAIKSFGEQGLLFSGELPSALRLEEFARKIATSLQRTPLVIGEMSRPVKKIAWCTGGAQGYFQQIVAEDVDVYITGEASEYVTALARETGVAFIAAGHHATERYGIKALGEHLATNFDLEHIFIDIDNPV